VDPDGGSVGIQQGEAGKLVRLDDSALATAVCDRPDIVPPASRVEAHPPLAGEIERVVDLAIGINQEQLSAFLAGVESARKGWAWMGLDVADAGTRSALVPVIAGGAVLAEALSS